MDAMLDRSEWPRTLADFTRQNAGRTSRPEIDDPEMGVQPTDVAVSGPGCAVLRITHGTGQTLLTVESRVEQARGRSTVPCRRGSRGSLPNERPRVIHSTPFRPVYAPGERAHGVAVAPPCVDGVDGGVACDPGRRPSPHTRTEFRWPI